MTIYPEPQKENLVKRMLPPSNANVPKLSRETGIPRDTLYGWRREALRAPRLTRPAAASHGEHWSSEEKLAILHEKAPPCHLLPKPDVRPSLPVLGRG